MYLKIAACYKILLAAGLWTGGCPLAQPRCLLNPDSLLELLTVRSQQERLPGGSSNGQALEGEWSRLRALQQSRLQLGSVLLERYVPLSPQGPLSAEALEDLRYLQGSCSRALNWNASQRPHPAGYLLQLDWQLQAFSSHIGALAAGMSLPGRGTLANSWDLLDAWLGELRQTRQRWGQWLVRYVSATRSAALPAL